jgi:hypothetical protein
MPQSFRSIIAAALTDVSLLRRKTYDLEMSNLSAGEAAILGRAFLASNDEFSAQNFLDYGVRRHGHDIRLRCLEAMIALHGGSEIPLFNIASSLVGRAEPDLASALALAHVIDYERLDPRRLERRVFAEVGFVSDRWLALTLFVRDLSMVDAHPEAHEMLRRFAEGEIARMVVGSVQ